jgi:hypothetical protein
MRVGVLVNTNEPLRRLHLAIEREGRCWAQIELLQLSLHDGPSPEWATSDARLARISGCASIPVSS